MRKTWKLPRRCQGRPALAILNKQDLAGQGEAFTAAQQQLAPYFKAIIPLTARDAASLQPLCQAVAQLLGTANLDPNAAALCSARQPSAAKEAGGRLWAGCCRGVHQRCAACPCPPDR